MGGFNRSVMPIIGVYDYVRGNYRGRGSMVGVNFGIISIFQKNPLPPLIATYAHKNRAKLFWVTI